MSAVEVRDLRVEMTGSGLDIVDQISFDIEEGEIIGLVGESGSGKTTVGTALLGFARRGARIAAGSVRIGGRDVLDLHGDDLRTVRGRLVAYVPQDPATALNPALRIGTQLDETLVAHGFDDRKERAARILEVLAGAGLPSDDSFIERYPHQLSGGQQQRVCIAIAFACRPSLIVLDEPTTGLDVTTQAHVLRTIRDLCATYRTAALYVSHDLGVVASLADRVLVLYAGRLAEFGTQSDVFARPAHPYTRRLLEAIPDIESRRHLASIPGSAPAPGNRKAGCAFAPRCALADASCTSDPPTVDIGNGRLVRCVRPNAETIQLSALSTTGADISTAASPILVASNIVVSYGHTRVLHGASLELAPDECLALVGESGSGKTSFARALIGLITPDSGEITFRGTALAGQAKQRPLDVRRAVQYVFQSPYSSLNPRRTIGQSVGMPLRHFERLGGRELELRVAAALERVSLPAIFSSRYPDQLSGGERQRVAIARALICEPEVLICDEITSALDVSVQATIVELLAELRRARQLALVFVTHDLALVRSVADRVAVLQRGRIVETGAVDQVLDRSNVEYTRSLLADTPRIRGALEGRPERTTSEATATSDG